MPEKVNLRIDDVPVEASQDSTILDAARAYDIYIPTLCEQPHLTRFGACRLCLVEIEGTDNLSAACTTPVAQGMEVCTNTPRLSEIRKTLIELLLLHHPLDCLVCDKGGECELQNLAFKLRVTDDHFGFQAPSAQVPDATNLLIQRDLRKCMLCGKCVRVCDEVRNIGALGFAHHGLIATIGYPEQQLANCEFCGQCLAVCPVGALSSKLSALEARPWELEHVSSVCPYCGCGCSYFIQHKDEKIVKVTSAEELGDNEGLLCVKGRFGYDFVHHPTRLSTPLIKQDGTFVEASWEQALQVIAEKLKTIKEEKGAEAIGGIASTRCTNEENYLFQKLMRGVLGTNNIDNYARLEHASSMVALNDTLGIPAATNSIQEVKDAQAILVIGANPTSSHVIMGIDIKQAVRNLGAELIVVDPGKTGLVPFAKSWLRVKPGSDVALLNAMARVIIDEGLMDKEFVEQSTEGYDALSEKLADYTPERVAQLCGIDADDLKNAARMFAQAETACIVYGSGLTQQSNGVDNVYALLNLLLLTGNLGRKGTGIHPLRATCNVQGACDMGALPDYLPGYQPVKKAGARKKLESAWGVELPAKPGLTLMKMIDAACNKKLAAMYIMGENPLLAFSQKEHVREGLEKLDFLVVQDIFLTETAQMADVVLPAASFAEKSGTFTNMERHVQRINPAIRPIAQSKPDAEILQAVAEAMGSSLGYSSPAKVMEEISELTPIYANISYKRLGDTGLQWPVEADGEDTGFLTDFKKPLPFHAVDYIPAKENAQFPYVLLSGGGLFHNASGTMTSKTRGLTFLSSEAELEINPADAQEIKVQDGDKVSIDNCCASLTAKVKLSERYPAGVVFLPKHFSTTPVNLITGKKLSKAAQTPASKITRVKISRLNS